MNNEQASSKVKQVSPQRRNPSGNPLQVLIDANSSAGKPWWSEALGVFVICCKAAYLPLRLIGEIANTLVALAFIGVFGIVGMFIAGYIPDAVVVKYLSMVGDRILSIVQSSGLLQ